MVQKIKIANKVAKVSTDVRIDDVRGQYYTHVVGGYTPFVSSLSQYIRTSVPIEAVSGNQFDIAFDTGNAAFYSNMCVVVEIPQIALGDLVVVPNTPIVPVPGHGLIRYCKYPGVRLFARVELLVNKKVVESYTADNVIDYRFNEIDVAKQVAFDRCVGQEQIGACKYAYNADQTGVPIANDQQLWGAFGNGPQTPKNVQPTLTLAIPILFNAFRDSSIINVDKFLSINQRSLRVTFPMMSDIVSHYINMPIAVPPPSFRFTSITVFTRAIFVDPEMVELYSRSQKTLVRNYQTMTSTITSTDVQTFSLDRIQYPVEAMYVKFVPVENTVAATSLSGSNIPTYDFWYVPAKLTRTITPISFISVTPLGAMFQNGVTYESWSMADLVDNLSLSILNVNLYSGPVVPTFMSAFVPWDERSILQSAPYPGSYVFNFSQCYRGDLTRGAAGYLDFTVATQKTMQFQLKNASLTSPVRMIIGVRFLNYYEPLASGNGIQYAFSVQV